MQDNDEMPLPYVKALSNEVKETKQIIAVAHNKMEQRKIENRNYYEPAKILTQNVRKTRVEFARRADAVLNKINEESEQLKQLKETNEQCLAELQKSAELLEDAKEGNIGQPLGIAVRAIAAMFPFVAFGLFVVCSQRD